MTVRALISQVTGQENLNFLLTNRVPRRWLTLFVGRLSKVRNPLVRETSIAIWKLFSDLDLSEARKTRFDSLHDCFTSELKEGARPVDPDPNVLTSPCDGIIGACGQVEDGMVLQVTPAASDISRPYPMRCWNATRGARSPQCSAMARTEAIFGKPSGGTMMSGSRGICSRPAVILN